MYADLRYSLNQGVPATRLDSGDFQYCTALSFVDGVDMGSVGLLSVFGVIWFVWAVLWFMFFLLLGLNRTSLTRMTGWFTVFISHLTGTIPAFFLLLGRYDTNSTYAALAAALAVIALAAAYFLGRKSMRSSAQPEQAANAARAA
jgi:AmiS/UreI family transporter